MAPRPSAVSDSGFHVPHHPHDLDRHALERHVLEVELHDLHSLAHGILVGPGLFGELFIDYDDAQSARLVVGLVERSARDEPDTHGFGIAGQDPR